MTRFIAAARAASRVACCVGVVAVIILSLLPQAELPNVGLSDKIEHTIAYGLLTFTGIIGFRDRWRAVAVGAWCMGVGLEGLQALVPGRAPSLLDAVANSAGVVLGLLIAWSANRWLSGGTRPAPHVVGR